MREWVRDMCCGLDEKRYPQVHLVVLSGMVLKPLEGGALQEKVVHSGQILRLYSLVTLAVDSVLPDCEAV